MKIRKLQPLQYIALMFLFMFSIICSYFAWHGGFILTDLLNQLIHTEYSEILVAWVFGIGTFCTIMYLAIKEL